MKIGNVELKNNLILAPMAGVTDLPFRLIVEKFNPGLVCTEMVSSKALFYGDEKTKQLDFSDAKDKLKKLKAMYEDEVLSKQEYEKAKDEILRRL